MTPFIYISENTHTHTHTFDFFIWIHQLNFLQKRVQIFSEITQLWHSRGT